jgi:hypothetical protein
MSAANSPVLATRRLRRSLLTQGPWSFVDSCNNEPALVHFGSQAQGSLRSLHFRRWFRTGRRSERPSTASKTSRHCPTVFYQRATVTLPPSRVAFSHSFYLTPTGHRHVTTVTSRILSFVLPYTDGPPSRYHRHESHSRIRITLHRRATVTLPPSRVAFSHSHYLTPTGHHRYVQRDRCILRPYQ